MAEEKGFKTDLTNVDPETGQMTWSVEYTANFDELYKEVSQLLDDAKGVANKTKDSFFKDYYNDVRRLRNQLRTYLRNEYPQEYARMKGISETSMTGGGTSGGTFTPGEGAQYATPFAFNKNKKAKGSTSNYYYKLGYKPVDFKKLRKQSKGTDYIDLYKEK